jgi:hypothetical protein
MRLYHPWQCTDKVTCVADAGVVVRTPINPYVRKANTPLPRAAPRSLALRHWGDLLTGHSVTAWRHTEWQLNRLSAWLLDWVICKGRRYIRFSARRT